MVTLRQITDEQLAQLLERYSIKRSSASNWYTKMRLGWLQGKATIEQMKRSAPPFMVGGYAWEKSNGIG